MFSEGDPIPKRYTGEGQDLSPPLKWTGAPKGTKSFALVCDDPDAPTPTPWVHWVIYGLAPSAAELPEHVPPQPSLSRPVSAQQGVNSFGKIGYNGPLPPRGSGWHRYYFKLYALDSAPGLAPGADKERLLASIQGHVLGQAQLTGKYRR